MTENKFPHLSPEYLKAVEDFLRDKKERRLIYPSDREEIKYATINFRGHSLITTEQLKAKVNAAIDDAWTSLNADNLKDRKAYEDGFRDDAEKEQLK